MLNQGALERSVLALLCFSVEHSPLLALKITPDLFAGKTNQLICRTALDYIGTYHNPPGPQLELLLEEFMRGDAEGKLLISTVQDLRQLQVDPTFVLTELDKFIADKKFGTMLEAANELYEAGDIDAAREEIAKQTFLPQQGTTEILLQDPVQSLKFFYKDQHDDFFSSGIGVLDEKGVRPERKTIMFMIAASGKGKSHWLVAVGKAGLQYHHKVLHITTELSQELTALRYIQSIFSLTKDQAKLIKGTYFAKDATGSVSFQFEEFQRESVISKIPELERRLRAMKSYPPFYIKEFPTSALSTEQLALYLDSLERERNFKPDLLVLDYADLMKIDAQSLRIDTGRLYRELRGIAVARNIALVTATQGNRESESAKMVGSTNVSEDWSKIGTSDNVLTYSQTAPEFQLGLARIFVAKSRSAADRFLTLISQNYSLCQFCLDSIPMNAALVSLLEQQA